MIVRHFTAQSLSLSSIISIWLNNIEKEVKHQGPVVQSVVSLKSLLRVISLTVLADSIHNILIFFAEKMWVAFALQKLLTFIHKKFQHICVTLDINFNESLTNDVVSFEQLGPTEDLIRLQNIYYRETRILFIQVLFLSQSYPCLFQVLTIDVKKDGLVNYVRDTAKKTNQADRLEILINVPGNNGNLQ